MAFILVFIATAIVIGMVAWVGQENPEVDVILEPYEDVLELTEEMQEN